MYKNIDTSPITKDLLVFPLLELVDFAPSTQFIQHAIYRLLSLSGFLVFFFFFAMSLSLDHLLIHTVRN